MTRCGTTSCTWSSRRGDPEVLPARRPGAAHPLRRLAPRHDLPGAWPQRRTRFIEGRGYVTPEDIKAVAPDVLRHRVILTYEAEALGRTPEDLLAEILKGVPVP